LGGGLIQAILNSIFQFAVGEFVSRIGTALLEVFCVGTLGLAPLLTASFLDIHLHGAGLTQPLAHLNDFIQLGQLFLYAFAMIGTLVWLLLARSTNAHVLFRIVLGLVTIAITIVSVGIFMQDPTMSTKLSDFLVMMSIVCLIGCLATYFFLLMCESAPVKPAGSSYRKDINKLVGQAEASHP
jgi:hypothetical protein